MIRPITLGFSRCPALHGLLLALLLYGMHPNPIGGGSGGTSSAGAGTGASFSVDLVATHDRTPDTFKIKMPDPSDTTDITAITPPQVLPVSMALDALIPIITQPVVTTPEDERPKPDADAESASHPPSNSGGTGQGGQASGIVAALWKQIEPCWQRLATKTTQNVTLSATLSPLGNVAQIDDAPNSIPPADAISRNEAIQALSECGPYVGASGGEDLMIAFSTPQ